MTDCPLASVLAAYEQGELNDVDARPVERHLRDCAACQAAIKGVRESDPDAALLRTVFSKAGDTALTSVATDQTEVSGEAESEPAPRDDSGSASGSGTWISPASASADWDVPDYERIRLCGEGSYGAVWAVRDRVGVFRALKIIDLKRLERAKIKCHELPALETYCRKVSRHPNLITIYHVGEIETGLYYTMELADDQVRRGPVRDDFPQNYQPLTLDTFITVGHLSVDVSLDLARRMLRGLARLHELGLVHRDVKPSNIVFVNRQPKLADIGVLTAEGKSRRIVGTPKYMPPDRIMDKTADTFAVARVLHEMIMGKNHESFPNLPDDDRWLGAKWNWQRVSKLVEHAASANAPDRYQDASIMLEALEGCTLGESASLLEEIVEKQTRDTHPAPSKIAIELAFAFIHRIPWIVGLILAIYIINKF